MYTPSFEVIEQEIKKLGILQKGDPRLQEGCRELSLPQELDLAKKICLKMTPVILKIRELYPSPRGTGLAAPQIGESVCIIAMIEPGETKPVFFINPVIKNPSRKETLDFEGCLSLFDVRGRVWRPDRIDLSYWDPNEGPKTVMYEGHMASLTCHECDHLAGKLFTDIMPENEELIPYNKYQTLRKTGKLPPKEHRLG